jgi:hypothetical protein
VTRPIAGLARAGVIGLTVAACGAAPIRSPTLQTSSAPTVSPASTTPPISIAPASPSGTPVAASAASPDVRFDESLLAILPPTVDGLVITSTPEVSTVVSADPQVALIADGYAVGVVRDPLSQEIAVALVIHLRTSTFGDAFFRSYRDSFDKAACEAAGGTVGNAEAQIAGRDTFIGTCAGGAHTYHVHVDGPAVIVSVVAASERRRLGELIIEGVRG